MCCGNQVEKQKNTCSKDRIFMFKGLDARAADPPGKVLGIIAMTDGKVFARMAAQSSYLATFQNW